MITRILLFLLLFLPSLAFGQLYGTGVGYVNGTPSHTPNIAQKGSEICISINNHMLYLWNRDSLQWDPTGAITVTFGAPIAAPGAGQTRTAINMQNGLIYWWNGSAWKEIIAYSVELANVYSAAVAELYANQVRAELADSTATLRNYADSLHLADDDRDSTNELQNLVLLGTVLNITDGNAVDFASLLSNYLLKTDTTALLAAYVTTAGFGLLKTGKTLRVDSSKVATRYYVGTNPTTIASTRISVSNGSNLVGYANFNYTDTRPTLNLGSAASSSSTTPALLDLGNTFSSVAGSNPKILLYSSASTYGIGISSSQMDYIVGNGANHSFWSTGVKSAYIDANSIRLPANKTLKFDAASASATTVALDLFGSTYGLNAFGSFINYVVPTGGGHSFYVSSNVAARITSASNFLLGTTTDVATSILTARSTTKSSSPFPLHTTVESNAITGANGNFEYITDGIGPALSWYNGTRKAYVPEATLARFTTGRLLFPDGNQQITESANLFWDNTNNRLGIGHANPSYPIHARGVNSGGYNIAAENTFNGTGATAQVLVINNAGTLMSYGVSSTSYTAVSTIGANSGYIYANGSGGFAIVSPSGGSIRLATGNSTERWRMQPTGYIGHGTNSPVSWHHIIPSYSGPGDLSGAGYGFQFANATYTDVTGNNTFAAASLFSIAGGTFNSPNATGGRTFTNFATLRVAAAPTAGTNVTITNSWAFQVVTGNTYLGGSTLIGSGSTGSPTQDLDVNGDGLFRDTLFVTSPPPHSTQDGFAVWKSTPQGYALGKATISSDLKYASGVLSLKHKSLIDSLPLAPVTIDAQDNAFAIINLNSLYFETNDGDGIIDLTNDIGTIATNTDLIIQVAQGDARIVLSDDPSIRMEVTGDEGAHPLIWDTQKFLLGYRSPTQLDTIFRVDIDGTVKAPAYGTGGKQNAASPYVAAYSTTGNLTEYRIRRDTFVQDATFSVGSLLSTCQELVVATSLTITAPFDVVVTLPAAAAALRGKRVTVYGAADASATYLTSIDVAGGVSHLYYSTNTSSTAPSAQASLSLDGTTWPHLGASYTFTCVLIDSNYRWVLDQQ